MSIYYYYFWPYHKVCRISVPYLGIKLMPLHWKHVILTTGLPGKSRVVMSFLFLIFVISIFSHYSWLVFLGVYQFLNKISNNQLLVINIYFFYVFVSYVFVFCTSFFFLFAIALGFFNFYLFIYSYIFIFGHAGSLLLPSNFL